MKAYKIEQQFSKFVFPSMLTMLLTGFYTIVDGFFIGQAVGDVGLAAINIAWPITAFMIALGMGIGTGGAVLISTFRGKDKGAEALQTRGNTLITLVAASAVMTVVALFTFPTLLRLMGASGEIYKAAYDYILVVIIGCSMHIFATGLTPILRNEHKTIETMSIMIVGLIVNIVLDYYFVMVFDYQLVGAAVATITAQAVTALLSFCCLILMKQNKMHLNQFKVDLSIIKRLLVIGISPFGMSFSPSIIIIMNNLQCLRYGQETAVATYAVLSYTVSCVQLLLSGIGEGIQPLISFCKGARHYESMKLILRKAVLLIVLMSIILFAISFPSQIWIPLLFGTSIETAKMFQNALFISSFAFLFIGIVKLASSYFYAIQKTMYAFILIYLDPCFISVILLWLLPLGFGLNGIWAALPVAQGLLSIIVLVMSYLHYNNNASNHILVDN